MIRFILYSIFILSEALDYPVLKSSLYLDEHVDTEVQSSNRFFHIDLSLLYAIFNKSLANEDDGGWHYA